MADTFKITGIKDFDALSKRLQKDVQDQLDLAAKTSVNKSVDLLAYGKITGINAKSNNPKGIVTKAARALRIPVEHIYYRTFTAGIKVSRGKKFRGIKPYASLMIRGNDIVVSDLLLSGENAKSKYGFQTRKKKLTEKKRPNMKAIADSARNGGTITVAGRSYRNSILADGSTRSSNPKMNRHYMENLGASSKMLKGKQMLLMQKRGGKKQKLPYPVKVVKIRKQNVMNALNAAANSSISGLGNQMDGILLKEVKRRMKRLGIELK